MNRADILLANSYFLSQDRKHQRVEGPFPPLGLLYLGAVLREKGYDVAMFDGTFKSGPRDFASAIDASRTRIVGIYSTVISRHIALEMARIAKDRQCKVLAGGPDASSSPIPYLRGGADVVGIGEGEVTIQELMQTIDGGDLEGVQGIAYQRDGRISRTPPRMTLTNLDSLPFPARDLVDMDAYLNTTRRYHGRSQTTVMTSRGCPFHCTWCAKPVFGNRYRHRSPAKVADEMLHLKATYGPEEVRFTDDVFTMNRRFTLDLCDEIEKRGAIIPFECLSRVDLVDEEILDRLKRIGCHRMLYGIESGSQKVLHSMRKGITLEEVFTASRLTRTKGIEQYWFLIFGYPTEGARDIRATMNLVRSLAPEGFGITVAYPLPGTEFYDIVKSTMREGEHWRMGRDNALLYNARYPAMFYKACILGTRAVHIAASTRRRMPGALSKTLDRIVARGVSAMVSVFDGVLAGEHGSLQAKG